MAHEWHAGVLSQSSWHGLESVETLPDAETMIRRGEETGAWPIGVRLEVMRTDAGLVVPGRAVVATYSGDRDKAHAAVSEKYRPLPVDAFRDTVRAAFKAGARPAGAFALRGGARVLATFEIGDGEGGIRNYLNVVDAYDGTMAFTVGGSSVRVVCANTLAMSMRQDGGAAQRIHHTRSIDDKAAALTLAIEAHVKEGTAVREAYEHARETKLTRDQAQNVFDALFPAPTKEIVEESPQRARNMEALRADAQISMANPVNNDGGGTLATIWNSATWLVDRTADGKARQTRSDVLDSMLFGTRGKRVHEIQTIINVMLRDGTVAPTPVADAVAMGVDPKIVAREIVNDFFS